MDIIFCTTFIKINNFNVKNFGWGLFTHNIKVLSPSNLPSKFNILLMMTVPECVIKCEQTFTTNLRNFLSKVLKIITHCDMSLVYSVLH